MNSYGWSYHTKVSTPEINSVAADRIEICVREACIAEARAPKPGNVHPRASFSDLTYEDFVAAAHAIAPVMADAPNRSVGETIFHAVKVTREQTLTNANLGIILLLSPLAASVGPGGICKEKLGDVLDRLTVEDSRWAYRAIRLASPGGMGKASEQDLDDEPTVTLLEAMRLAADRDSIARQYITRMNDVAELGPRILKLATERSGCGEDEAIVWCHLQFMAIYPDSLIARKQGLSLAVESQRRAANVISKRMGRISLPSHGLLESPELAELDAWLRDDSHRKNPGTSADLVAASLFVNAINRHCQAT